MNEWLERSYGAQVRNMRDQTCQSVKCGYHHFTGMYVGSSPFDPSYSLS